VYCSVLYVARYSGLLYDGYSASHKPDWNKMLIYISFSKSIKNLPIMMFICGKLGDECTNSANEASTFFFVKENKLILKEKISLCDSHD